MKIILPMAGLGTRLRPLTWSRPKPLLNVAGKPVLGHILDRFAAIPSIDELIFIVGYLGDQIQEYMRHSHSHLKARFVEQTELLGQSHALSMASGGLQGPALVAFVDTIIEADLSGLDDPDAEAVIWVKQVEDPRRFGVVELGPGEQVQRIIEKPQDARNNLAVVGFYYFQQSEHLAAAIERQLRSQPRLKGEYYLADALNLLLQDGLRMRARQVQVWKDCGTAEALLDTNRYLLEHGCDNSDLAVQRAGVVVVPPVYVHPSAEVRHCVIGPNASIGDGCRIERSLIQDSIVEAGSTVRDCCLSRSLLGRNARLSGKPGSFNLGDSAEVGLL